MPPAALKCSGRMILVPAPAPCFCPGRRSTRQTEKQAGAGRAPIRSAAAGADSPELQPPAEDVGLHGLALLGAEAELGNQLRRVLQRVTVPELTYTQGDTVKLHNSKE